jgi:outer membrane receptor protein involved in Fe transport
MSSKIARQWGLLVVASALISAPAVAQDDPFADEPAEAAPDAAPAEPSEPAEPEAAPPEEEPSPPVEEEPAPAAEAEATTGVGAETNVSLSAATTEIDTESALAPAPAPDSAPPVVAGSHIRRPRLTVDGALIVPSPLRTEVQGREYLQIRRQLSGAAMPDVTAALGFGAAGTSRIELRLQPTLILLNGKRLPTAPFLGPNGSDFVDTNMIPIQLVDRTEITSGHAAALYGEGAMGGVANFTTRRDVEGIDIELGGQSTDKFDQGEADVAVLMGTGEGKSGANVMVSYFNRQPLAAQDRDWIGERTDRVESLLSNPSAFQQISNNIDFPISDPLCDIATQAGHAEGYEVRLRGYGAVSNLRQLTEAQRTRFVSTYDEGRGLIADQRDGDIDPLQAPTYCAVDYTKNNDLILKDERLQLYSTFWHGLSDHTEIYGEAGYYRSDNENRTAPAFPLLRSNLSVERDIAIVVPNAHADTPLQSYGFAGRGTGMGAARAELFMIGRTQGNFNGDGINNRRVDAFRGVLGIKGDLKAAAPNTIFSTWDWDVGGTFGTSELLARVNDTLLSKLHEALESCAIERVDPTTGNTVSTTIKERQEAGCYNPYYNSVTNNAALDPLNVSNASAQISANGFVTSDTDMRGVRGAGLQDGGYICDPANPESSPCPAGFDRNGDGIFELAGTPNTQQVIDRITGEHVEYQKRSLATVDATMRGDIVKLGSDGALSFGLGTQFRHESLLIDYDQAYNERDYGFLFGADDLEPVTRDVIAGNIELRLSIANGLLEVQPAFRVEAYDKVGMGMNGLFGVALRPFANSDSEALRFLGLRGHVGYGEQPPSLTQMYGMVNEFVQVDYRAATIYIPQQISGNADLDFEKYTTVSGGPMWDWAGIHVGADFWMTFINDVIANDNPRTLVNDCRAQFDAGNPRCSELVFFFMSDSVSHIRSKYDNMAEVDTNGVDGTLSYTLDSKRRGLGDFGTFVLGVQGTFVNTYMIKGPRVLAAYYRDNAPERANPESFAEGAYASPVFNEDGTRDYGNLNAEYEAAGYRNFENFAPPIPKLRFTVPLRWIYGGHTAGATMRFIDSYFDDSEYTIEKRDLEGVDRIQYYDGEKIAASMLFDLMYGFSFGNDAWKGGVTVGVLNVADTAPPAVESPLGYEVGLHDPRGRTIYARLSGDF